MYPFPVPDLLSYGIRPHLFKSISCLYLAVNPLTKWCVWFDLMEKKSQVHVLIYFTVTFVQILKSLSIRTLSHLLNQCCQTMSVNSAIMQLLDMNFKHAKTNMLVLSPDKGITIEVDFWHYSIGIQPVLPLMHICMNHTFYDVVLFGNGPTYEQTEQE